MYDAIDWNYHSYVSLHKALGSLRNPHLVFYPKAVLFQVFFLVLFPWVSRNGRRGEIFRGWRSAYIQPGFLFYPAHTRLHYPYNSLKFSLTLFIYFLVINYFIHLFLFTLFIYSFIYFFSAPYTFLFPEASHQVWRRPAA